ncbi:hypothetical protein P7K49_009035 [Saguinus oedipus]|uniref:Uncharacterized protein n=1 Tax=Saguinus oedipus TaxID=9490 RepID=A0ABQ9VZH2_SAGOE|nr:hypothetical protein P7K49_009035 [Saguinus oedipus]
MHYLKNVKPADFSNPSTHFPDLTWNEPRVFQHISQQQVPAQLPTLLQDSLLEPSLPKALISSQPVLYTDENETILRGSVLPPTSH